MTPLLTDRDLMAALQIRKSAFYRDKALGRYRHLEVSPQMTRTTRYSGKKVQDWMDGKASVYTRTWGRKAG